MKPLSRQELTDLELQTSEQMSEYMLELAKAKARIDAELYYKNSIELRKSNAHNSFLYSFLLGIVGICIGFWISYFAK
ncbi:hypothetical protein LY28_03630 [Ruminiclostridium sufflavum DSM 19573]|uniref:Uncharacterized protein n=1 Tax=Ruminiclostridium sufflavum DSM 19573 TaxID=1121337 RepID=A0A318XFX6_9FIRM|nr:hypothetical protein [Ruminiclostridium sufflavum]PYG84367.1 hypothetical protein LY28_03630 [Ruminiclostridium sufflavum DSM 19573]